MCNLEYWKKDDGRVEFSLFNKAMKLRDVTSEDEEAANLTIEECKAIKKINAALDKCYELHCEFIQEMKVHRFSIQEALTFFAK